LDGDAAVTSVLKFILKFINRLVIKIGVTAPIFAFVYLLVVITFSLESDRPIYWLALYFVNDNSIGIAYAGLVLILGIIYVVVAVIGFLFLRKEDRKFLEKGASAIINLYRYSFFILSGGTYAVAFLAGSPLGIITQHKQTVHTPNHVYHLLFYEYDPAEGYNARYRVYRCSSHDIFCVEIYSISESFGGLLPATETINLISDLNSDSISVEVNGEIAFTYPSQ
jgi:hypothetical protein